MLGSCVGSAGEAAAVGAALVTEASPRVRFRQSCTGAFLSAGTPEQQCGIHLDLPALGSQSGMKGAFPGAEGKSKWI